MNLSLLLKTITRRMSRFKLKTVFMGLGITVAVLATVLLQTALMSIEDTFASFVNRSYPSNSLVLMTGSGFMGGAARANLEISDVEAVVNSLGIKQWDPVIMIGPRDVKQQDNIGLVNVAGYSERAETVRSRSAQEGEFFTAEEVRNRSNVALIGSTTAKTLFPGRSPVGANLFIDNVSFTVKGVLETTGVDPHGGDQDNTIWIPYTTLMDKVMKTNQISGATLMIEDPSRLDNLQKEVTQILRERHQIGAGQQDDFSIVTPVSMGQLRAKMFSTWKLFIRLIAGTVFLVAAIVILSIMQVSIKGRTAEIGLRKALGGAPPRSAGPDRPGGPAGRADRLAGRPRAGEGRERLPGAGAGREVRGEEGEPAGPGDDRGGRAGHGDRAPGRPLAGAPGRAAQPGAGAQVGPNGPAGGDPWSPSPPSPSPGHGRRAPFPGIW